MNGVDSHQGHLKGSWGTEKGSPPLPTRFAGGGAKGAPSLPTRFAGGGAGALPPAPPTSRKLLGFWPLEDEVASAVVPPVTVVLEGRSICHRVCLHKHAGYESLALALRRMFVDDDEDGGAAGEGRGGLDLSNAVPGYMVAYEDMEDDLLLAGDLDWKDFVRVAKRIRILPAKASRRKHSGGAEP